MNSLVVDASVAVKWVVQEPGTAEALALRKYRLSAPELLVPECANILWKKVRRKELSVAQALIGARLLERADVELAPMRNPVAAATRLAISLNHPAYDCLYLTLARTIGAVFITADERLIRRTKATNLGARVLLLGSATDNL